MISSFFQWALVWLTGFSAMPPQQADLPPRDSYQWDTLQVFATANDVKKLKHEKDSAFFGWYKRHPQAADQWFTRDSLMWSSQEAFAVILYKTLLRSPKDQPNFLSFFLLSHLGYNLENEQLTSLFLQYPESLRKSSTGKNIASRLKKNFGEHEGRNIKNLLNAARVTAIDGKTNSISALMADARPLNVLVFGASWCRPCRYQDILLHRGMAGLDPSRFRIIHLSVDTNRKKWETSEKSAGYERDAYLLPGGFEGSLVKQLRINGVPRYLVLDDKGNVMHDNLGEVRKVIRILKARAES